MRLLPAVLFLLTLPPLHAQDPTPPPPLAAQRWTPTLNIPDPVGISFDNRGRAYVSQTRRRKAQDLDIRQHREWIPADLALETVEDKRAFYRRTLSPETSAANAAHIADFNADGSHDWRDLTVLSEEIHLVEDTDGDGLADKRSTFADDFRTEVTGIAAGVLWHEGAVYATIAPDFWRLEDRDGDDIAEHRESIAHGFGNHIALGGHDMHGPVPGPDGRIYWSIGDKGISVTTPDGVKHHYPNQGGILRCNPDGSDFEVFAHGLRNLQEFAFDAYGNIFGVDNDSDNEGERERLVYVVRGSDSGWRSNWQYRRGAYSPWMDEKMHVPWREGQAAYITPAIRQYRDGPSGFAWNPGTALSPEYRDCFFLAQFPAGNVHALRLAPKGASFEMTEDALVATGFASVGLSFAPDGALYAVDWGGGYPLNEKGAVWRLDVPEENRDPARSETAALLASDFSKKKTATLYDLLSHTDRRIRLAAQFELARGPAQTTLLYETASDTTTPLLARIHALWAIGQQLRAAKAESDIDLVALIKDPHPEIRAQVAQLLGDTGSDPSVKSDLLPLLADPSLRVRFHAALALGSIIDPDPDPITRAALVIFLADIEPSQTFLRHAGMMGLLGNATPRNLAALSKSESTQVRLAALVALRRLRHPHAARFLKDENELVVLEAARAIHDDFSIPRALPALATLLEDPPSDSEVLLRRAINANLRLGGAAPAARLAAYAAEESAPSLMRLQALDALANWSTPPSLDRVTGRHRDYPPRDQSEAATALEPVLATLLKSPDPAFPSATLILAAHLGLALPEAPLAAIVRDQEAPATNRRAALQYLHSRKSERAPRLAAAAAADADLTLALAAIDILGQLKPSAAVARITTLLEEAEDIPARQECLAILAGMATPGADAILEGWMRILVRDPASVPPALQLDLLEAARFRSEENSTLANFIADYDSALAEKVTAPALRSPQGEERDLLAPYQVTLAGGNPARGKHLFRNHLAAQCIRCHRDARKSGSDVGPDLSKIGKTRKPAELLESLVNPAARITPGYGTIAVTRKDNSTLMGNLLAETETHLTLRTPDGKEVAIPLTEIESRTAPISLMPPMGGVLTLPELRDVIAYLVTLK